MYLEWMKKHLLIISVLQFCLVILVLIIKKEFHYEIFLAAAVGSGLFGVLQYLICRFFYKESKSLKINLMLIMWDVFFCVSVILAIRNSRGLIPIVIILFLIRTELVIFSKKFKIMGK